MYHWHTIVYHKYGFWSTVACNKTRPEISKACDVHLILLGELKYGEIRPIQTSSDNPGTADWDKFEQWFQKACRDNPPSTPIPLNVRQKRSTTSINYFDMNCGKPQQESRTSRQHKTKGREPITLSEPSAERVAAQWRIKLEKLKQKQNRTGDDISVICEVPPDIDDTEITPTVKLETEIKTEIKQEHEQRNTRHIYKGKEVDWLKVRYIHKDGSICNKERRLQEESIRELESQLPDLPDSLCDETSNNIPTLPLTSITDQSVRKGLNDGTSTTTEITDNNLHVETGATDITTTISSPNPEDQAVFENNQTDTENLARLPVETPATRVDIPQQSPQTTANESIDDKINAAEGLLLLGTDVSSADDSQEVPDPASVNAPNIDTTEVPHTETDNHEDIDNESDKTIITGLHDETSEPVKSPKKGVLNFRQIGIKRHQPVDSSDPSAIGSPPGSPENVQNQNTHKKRRRNLTTKPANPTKRKNRTSPKPTKKPRLTISKSSKHNEEQRKKRSVTPSQPTASSSSLDAETENDRKYSIKRTVVNGTVYYHCSYCNKKYNTLHGLNNHHEETHPPVQCDVCNREFITPNSLIHHSYTHYEQSFTCDQCNKSFPFKSQLETHQAVHTQEIKYRCEKCGKGFVRIGEYNIHMKGHANIRLKCPEKGCDYNTVDIRNLNSHKKSHTKRKSVFCKICGEGFVYHEQRKRHMKVHT